MILHLPHYENVWLDRDFPKDKQGLHYMPRPRPWRTFLARDEESNRYLPTSDNILLVITEHPELAGLFWYENDRHQVYIVGKLPGVDMFVPDRCRPFRRDDLTAVHAFIEREVPLVGITRQAVFWQVRHSAKTYHRFLLSWWEEDDDGR